MPRRRTQPGAKSHDRHRHRSPGVQLAYHTHPTTESITLLEGAAVVEVEGRRYRLAPLDNVVVPPGVAHSVVNAATERDARFHIAFPTDAPVRELVEPGLSAPNDARRFERARRDRPGAGQPHCHRAAIRCRHGSDVHRLLQRDLMPGIEMSGGYGLFRPGGRLPAHIHDFDESICIVEGTATCVVEGRRYTMSGLLDRAAAARAGPLLRQRKPAADGDDLGLRRPEAGANRRRRAERDRGRKSVAMSDIA